MCVWPSFAAQFVWGSLLMVLLALSLHNKTTIWCAAEILNHGFRIAYTIPWFHYCRSQGCKPISSSFFSLFYFFYFLSYYVLPLQMFIISLFTVHAHSFFNQLCIISRFSAPGDNVNYTMKFGQQYNISPRFLFHSGQVKFCYLKLFLTVMVYSDSLQLLEYYKKSII